MSGAAVHVIRSVAELEAIREEWETLSERFGTPLLDHDWFACGARALHDERDLRVVVVRRGGELTGLAPLAVDRAHGRRLVLIGSAALYEPGGWIYASESALEDLAQAVAGLGSTILMHRVPRGSPMDSELARLLRGRALTLRRPVAACMAVDTTGDWQTSHARLTGRALRNLRSRRSRAERECGELSIERLRPETKAVDSLIDMLGEVEGSGWKRKNGSSLSARPEVYRFFQAYFRRAAERGRLVVSRLALGGTTAAVEFAVAAHQRLWTLKIGYDERFAGYGPGILLADSSIVWAHEQGLAAYEFLGSAELWQDRWKPVRQDFNLVLVYPFRIGALGVALSDALSFAVRRLQRAPRSQAQPTE
jgi:CelD/BcsL family acetyltransferase involved in cellulose biosynthesis